ncbi:hypothetical protein HPB51_017260 [Rhipicephalus microplus]|uniref:Transposase n=1 Tax=Rhipicephalus microplus TaxID=6941 RepID=A0A9J6EUI6_RHIMP|nr:hypothetical protein HPB51_017260 [Rhipicephalus microplus]
MTAKTRLLRHDTFAMAALRRKVHSYFMRNELPMVEELRNDMISDPEVDMPTISTRTMQRMLKDLGVGLPKEKKKKGEFRIARKRRDRYLASKVYFRTTQKMWRQQW